MTTFLLCLLAWLIISAVTAVAVGRRIRGPLAEGGSLPRVPLDAHAAVRLEEVGTRSYVATPTRRVSWTSAAGSAPLN